MASIPVETNVVVVGAGPAGLAVGTCLTQAGVPCVLLEQNQTVASAWHRHYDRLHLHTAKINSELPFVHYPKHYPRYLSRAQVIEYLDSYARRFQLDIRFGEQVVSASQDGDIWIVRSGSHVYEAPALVVASGYNREPVLPSWPGQQQFQGTIIHSAQYKNGDAFRGQNALVVGFGNSGGEIAIDLWEHGAKPGIAVRSAVNVIPRDLFGIPTLSIAVLENRIPPKLADAVNALLLRLMVGDLTPYGLRKLPYGPLTQARNNGRVPLVDVGTIRLIKEGHLVVYPGLREFTQRGVIFDDGRQAEFEAVILATGYRPRVDSFLKADDVFRANGTPITSGCESSLPGLYFCGFYISPNGMLREIAKEAKQISRLIASHSSREK